MPPRTFDRPFAMLSATVAAGLLATLWSLIATWENPQGWPAILPFLATAIVAEFMCVHVYQARGERISFSFSMAATMAAVAALPTAAPLITLLASIVATAIVLRQRQWNKVLFNLANPVLAALVAALLYEWLRPGDDPVSVPTVVAALLAVLAYIAVNVGLVSAMIALHSGRSLASVLSASGWFAPTNVLLGLTGAFVGGAFAQLGGVIVAMFIMPVLLMRYTLAFYARRSQATIQMLEDQATRLEHQADRLEQQATHDALTNLPNRSLLERRLEQLLAPTSGRQTALLLLDLDRFKEINDTFGHRHGDLLLQQIGPRLEAVLPAGHTIARLGGDEFAVIVPNATSEVAQRIARDLLEAFARPFVVEGYPVEVGASLGIAAAAAGEQDPTTLLRQADVAMYIAKRGQLGLASYRRELDQYSPERLTLVGELRQAIESDLLRLFYQPQVCCRTGRVLGVEALLRWEHPTRGNIPPADFVALAERTGLIRPLTRWVLDQALRQCREWLNAGHTVPVAVNASMYDFHDLELPNLVGELLAKRRIPASCLRIELTEGTLMADEARTLDVLARLRALGVEIAVDDFGTGFSSLAYLSRLPVNELKIDRSFVNDMHPGGRNSAIVRSTIGLGHELGLRVVAEGVEDEATWDLLRRFGSDVAQGYWISRPLSPDMLARWLASSTWPVPSAHPLQAAA